MRGSPRPWKIDKIIQFARRADQRIGVLPCFDAYARVKNRFVSRRPLESDETPTEASEARAATFRSGAGAIALITVAAAILRIYDLGTKSFWFDETATAMMMALSPRQLAYLIMHREANMVLYHVLMYPWASFAGTGEFMLRLPSAICGAATVPLIFLLGKELRDRSTGLIAALLLALNATCIQYAQDARSYTMYVALATLASVFFVRMVKRGAANDLVGYILSGALGIYAHLFAIMAVPAQTLSLLVFRPPRKKLVLTMLGLIAVVVLGSGAFYFAISGDQGNVGWVPPTSFDSLLNLLLMFAGDFERGLSIFSVLLLGFYGLGVILALALARSEDWPALGYLLLSILVPIAVTAAVSHFKHLFISRYLLAELPPFVVLSAIGFQRLRPPLMAPLVLAFALVSLGQDYVYYQSGAIEDWRGMIGYVASRSNPGDLMLVFPRHFRWPIEYYVSRLDHPERFPSRIVGADESIEGRALGQLEGLVENSPLPPGGHIWVATGLPIDEQGVQLMFSREQLIDARTFGAGGAAHLFEFEKNH
jgi:mannosyltransferase